MINFGSSRCPPIFQTVRPAIIPAVATVPKCLVLTATVISSGGTTLTLSGANFDPLLTNIFVDAFVMTGGGGGHSTEEFIVLFQPPFPSGITVTSTTITIPVSAFSRNSTAVFGFVGDLTLANCCMAARNEVGPAAH